MSDTMIRNVILNRGSNEANIAAVDTWINDTAYKLNYLIQNQKDTVVEANTSTTVIKKESGGGGGALSAASFFTLTDGRQVTIEELQNILKFTLTDGRTIDLVIG